MTDLPYAAFLAGLDADATSPVDVDADGFDVDIDDVADESGEMETHDKDSHMAEEDAITKICRDKFARAKVSAHAQRRFIYCGHNHLLPLSVCVWHV